MYKDENGLTLDVNGNHYIVDWILKYQRPFIENNNIQLTVIIRGKQHAEYLKHLPVI